MNILFFIGNGFDLNLGMKTSYNDFYKFYTENKNESENETIKKLKNTIDKNLENWSDLELALGKYTKNLSTIEEVDSVLGDLKDELQKFLEAEEKLVVDSIKVNEKVFYDHLINPEQFLLQRDKEVLEKLKFKHQNTMSWNVDIISFNYTRTFEKLINDSSEPQLLIVESDNRKVYLNEVKHVHGFTDSRMILGVNDKTQVINEDFHSNSDITESLIKPECNEAMRHGLERDYIDNISKAHLICIFGSSIGDTDRFWWDKISQRLAEARGSCKLIFFRKGEEIPPNRESTITREVRKAQNIFLKSLKEVEKDKVKGNIILGYNTEMFSISKILKK